MNILVFGGNGFLGSTFAKDPSIDYLSRFNFRLSGEVGFYESCDFSGYVNLGYAISHMQNKRYDLAVNCVGLSGGMNYCLNSPYEIFYKNINLARNITMACKQQRIPLLMNIMSSCAYPGNPSCYSPISEDYFLVGEPHGSVLPIGQSKRSIFIYGKLLSNDLENLRGVDPIKVICPVLPTLYGNQYHDAVNPSKNKFICSIVNKVRLAKRNNEKLVMNGTGLAVREYLRVDKAVQALLMVARSYGDASSVINIGVGHGETILEITRKICQGVHYDFGDIQWNNDKKQDGQLYKVMDVTKANRLGIKCEPNDLVDDLVNSRC